MGETGRKPTQAQRVLARLREAGDRGVTVRDLFDISNCPPKMIETLRRSGCFIDAPREKVFSEKRGRDVPICRYILVGEPVEFADGAS